MDNPKIDLVREAYRLADLLEHGDYYDVGSTSVVYGWRIGGKDCSIPDEAAELLIAMAEEIKRLRSQLSAHH
jgi:hypothetical protein